MASSHFASQYTRLRASHDKVKAAKADIDSLIDSCNSIQAMSEYDVLRVSLRKAVTHLSKVINDYSESVSKLRRQVECMLSDNDDREEAKSKEEELFHKMRDLDNDDVSQNETILTGSLLPFMKSLVEDTLSNAYHDAHMKDKKDSIQSSTVTPPGTNQTSMSDDQSNGNQNNLLTAVLSRFMENSNVAPLPPITLIPFDGESTQWEPFFSQYTHIIGSREHLSDIEKLTYLRQALKGAAHRTVEGIPIGNEYLQATIDRLQTVYGRGKRTNSILIHQLNSIHPKSSSIEDQLECTEKMINKVIQFSDKSIVDNFALIHQIAGSIHSKHIDKMYDDEPSTMMEALTLIESDLRKQIELKKMKATFCPTNRNDHHSNQKQKDHNQSTDIATSKPSMINGNQHPLCVYCGKHSFSDCRTITSVAEKKDILKQKKLCFRCLSSNHLFNQCEHNCQICSKPHHKSICESNSTHQSIITATLTCDDPEQEVARLYTTQSLIQNPMKPYSANRHVLLDTGGMVSMISRSLVNELHLQPQGTLPLALTGVGGIPTGGNTHEFVRVDIVTGKGPLSVDAIITDSPITRPMTLHPLSAEDYTIVQSKCGHVPHLTGTSTVTPDLLISIAETQEILADSISTSLPSGYMLIQSILGPMIAGKAHSSRLNPRPFIHSIMGSIIAEKPSNVHHERDRLESNAKSQFEETTIHLHQKNPPVNESRVSSAVKAAPSMNTHHPVMTKSGNFANPAEHAETTTTTPSDTPSDYHPNTTSVTSIPISGTNPKKKSFHVADPVYFNIQRPRPGGRESPHVDVNS